MKTSSQSNLPRRGLGRLMALAIAAVAVPNGIAETSPAERFWQVNVAGQASGSFTETTVSSADGKVRTKETMALELNRLGSKISMKTESETLEATEGMVESLTGSVSSSQAVTNVRASRVEGAFEVETEAGGKSYQKKIPLSGTVLGPKGVEKLSRENLKTEGATVSFQMFSVEMGGIVSMTRKAVARLEEEGHSILRVEETIEGMPGKQVVTLDENGRWLTRRQSLPFGELTLEPSTRSAPAAQSGPALPAESYDQTMARSNILLPDPRTLTKLRLKLRHHKPDLGWPDLESATQRVVEQSDTTRVVEVRGFTPPGRPKAKSEEAPDESYLRPNPLVQSDDAEVTRIAQETTKGVQGDFEKARRLQDWVSQNLQLDLGIVLAPASEVVRNRRGTCVAYAILLASLERAIGLPSRVAMGYAYANGIWGGHAWTEVFIDGQWVALDAALYAPGTADAARLWFGASSGDDQMIKAVGGGAQMYGHVDFQVLFFERGGRTVAVPETAVRHTINGNRYSNPWLGFSMAAPPNFRFTKLDAVFPDPTIVALEDGNDGRISVRVSNVGADEAAAKRKALALLGNVKPTGRRLGKLKGEVASTPQGMCFLWREGNSLWSISAEGESASRLLEEIATSWQWNS